MKNGYLLGVDTRTSGSQSTMSWDSIPDYWESKPVRRLGVNSRQVQPLAHRHWESIPVPNYQSRALDVGVNPRCFTWWQWESIPDLMEVVGTGGSQSPLMDIYEECANATKQNCFLCRFVQFCFSWTGKRASNADGGGSQSPMMCTCLLRVGVKTRSRHLYLRRLRHPGRPVFLPDAVVGWRSPCVER
jgi:hypothetical protein